VSLLVAGIDGGQSSTVALVADETGRILGRGAAGPADEIGTGPESTRLRDALHGALHDATVHAGIATDATFAAIVAGISGYNGTQRGRPPRLPSERVKLMHDAPIAHAGALAGRPGIVIIAGTGSVIYGRDDAGHDCTLGGWGFLFGDEGSAFRIAADAIAALMRAQDEGEASLAGETAAALAFFNKESLRAIGRGFYAGDPSRDRVAAFAPVAMRSKALRDLAYTGADRLAVLACAAVERGFAPEIALAGGVFDDDGFRRRVRAAILERTPGARVVAARYSPAAGALLLAYRALGLDIGELQE
jgi:N-acetylglucosamine kinase-like BadF-type ATPase